MSLPQVFLIHGPNTVASEERLGAIRNRFLTQADSVPDLVDFDALETDPATLRQALYAVPFFATHRLFVIKSPFQAAKLFQETLAEALATIPKSTVVVLFEPKQADARLKLWQWLKSHATIYSHDVPSGVALERYARMLAKCNGATLESSALRLILEAESSDMNRLKSEITKLALAAKSQGETSIGVELVSRVASLTVSPSVFLLTDAVRDGDSRTALRMYRQARSLCDPMAVAGMLANLVRTLAKLKLAGPVEPTKATGLHPYAVTLSLPVARRLSLLAIKKLYDRLIEFETDVKTGRLEADLALVLLIVRLGDRLKVDG